MGVIQQSFNQAVSVAGLAKQLYQQSPGYQKKTGKKEFIEGQKILERQLKVTKKDSPEREAIEGAINKLGEMRSNELLARGKYEEWARQEKHNAINRAGHFGPVVEFDEQRAQEANDRAEDTTRQIIAQRDAYKSVLDQLRGVNQVSQAFLHKEGIK